jgi:hypothetical protein
MVLRWLVQVSRGRVPLSTFRADIDYALLRRILLMVEWVSSVDHER